MFSKHVQYIFSEQNFSTSVVFGNRMHNCRFWFTCLHLPLIWFYDVLETLQLDMSFLNSTSIQTQIYIKQYHAEFNVQLYVWAPWQCYTAFSVVTHNLVEKTIPWRPCFCNKLSSRFYGSNEFKDVFISTVKKHSLLNSKGSNNESTKEIQ